MVFLVYIDTLNGATHEIIRTGPKGWVSRSRERDAKEEAARRFSPAFNQALALERTTASAIKKVTRRQATAVLRGTDASFATCYQAMLMARKSVKTERPRQRMMQKFSMDAMLPGL